MISLIGFSSLLAATFLNFFLIFSKFIVNLNLKKFNLIIRSSSIFTFVSFFSLMYAYVTSDFKFFLVAEPKIRAERRHKQINDDSVKVDIIEEEIKQRDKTDSTREIAPLKKAVDAFKIDVSTLTIDQVFNKILQKIKSH